MQADRRLVEHVHRAGELTAHRSRELDALAFAGRQRGARTVEREIAESEFEQTPCGARELVDD